MRIEESFYVVARESGQEHPDLPTWADRAPGNIELAPRPAVEVTRREVPMVLGAFHLLGVLSSAECDRFVEITEALGYHSDAPVSLPHSIRHNTNLNWIVDESIDEAIWGRCAHLVPDHLGEQPALGLNARFRFYRYAPGDFFRPHTDGAWPGSRVVDGRLTHDAYGDRISYLSCLLFLSDGYRGGRTLFYVGPQSGGTAREPSEENAIAVVTPKGAALVFPHGYHPLHCLHAGEPISAGTKYIIRTDVLFGLPAR